MAAARVRDLKVYETIPGGIRLRLKVQPKSRREGPQGLVALPEGGVALKFGVGAAPEGGQANAAIIALLARRLKVAKAAISVAQGAKDRRKLVDIQGPSDTLAAALDAWLGPLTETMDGATS